MSNLIKADQVNVVSDKVKLTKEQANAIKWAFESPTSWTKETLIASHVGGSLSYDKVKPLHDIHLDTLIRALYIGYTIEQTIEEQLLERYKKHNEPTHSGRTELSDVYDKGVANGIYETLDIIGMKVKGINA